MRPDEGAVEVLPRPTTTVENLRALFGFDLPSPLGTDEAPASGIAIPAAVALRSVLPAGMLAVLRNLPLPLWWGDEPRVLALADAAYVIED